MIETFGLGIAAIFIGIYAALFFSYIRIMQEIRRVEWSVDKLREKLDKIESEFESLSRSQSYRDFCDTMSTEVSKLDEEIELSDDVNPFVVIEEHEEQLNVPEDTFEDDSDNLQAYATLFLKDCPLTQKFKVARINNDIAEVMRIMLYDTGLSTSSYVNNILAEHFREHQFALERKSREVAASLTDSLL